MPSMKQRSKFKEAEMTKVNDIIKDIDILN